MIALGANLPFEGQPPEVTLRRALSALSEQGLRVAGVSRLFRTPCFPRGAGPDYVNAAAVLATDGLATPAEVLDRLHRVEARFGRRRVQRWGMRTLDLDLLAMGSRILPGEAEFRRWLSLAPEDQARLQPEGLILPHPRLQDRGFVLVPLADVAPDWVHPVLGQSVRDLCAALPPAETAEIRPLAP